MLLLMYNACDVIRTVAWLAFHGFDVRIHLSAYSWIFHVVEHFISNPEDVHDFTADPQFLGASVRICVRRQ